MTETWSFVYSEDFSYCLHKRRFSPPLRGRQRYWKTLRRTHHCIHTRRVSCLRYSVCSAQRYLCFSVISFKMYSSLSGRVTGCRENQECEYSYRNPYETESGRTSRIHTSRYRSSRRSGWEQMNISRQSCG
jgi:hypothetical protein